MTTSRAAAVLFALIALAGLGACGSIPIGADYAADAGADKPRASAPCTLDIQCKTEVDYCTGTCGVCVAVTQPLIAKCQPPVIGQCMNVCAGVQAVCRGGVCVTQ